MNAADRTKKVIVNIRHDRLLLAFTKVVLKSAVKHHGALYTEPQQESLYEIQELMFSLKSLRFRKPNIHSCQLKFTVHRC